MQQYTDVIFPPKLMKKSLSDWKYTWCISEPVWIRPTSVKSLDLLLLQYENKKIKFTCGNIAIMFEQKYQSTLTCDVIVDLSAVKEMKVVKICIIYLVFSAGWTELNCICH